MDYKFFRSKLPPEDKEIYDLIYGSLVLLEQNILLRGRILVDKIERIVDYIIRDNPDIFFVDSFRFQLNDVNLIIFPEYLFPKKKILRWRSECIIRANNIAKRCGGFDEYHKLVLVHDIFIKNLTYKNDHSREVHTIVSPLLVKYGVCEGFAKTFKLILDILEIPCIIVNGLGKDPISNEETPHMWNLAWVDGSWNHYDITFDVNLSYKNKIRYDYFALSDTDIERDHIFSNTEFPSSINPEQDFYSKSSLKFNEIIKLENFIETCIQNDVSEYVFKLSGKFFKNNKVDDIIHFIQGYYSTKEINGSLEIRYNKQQHVFHVIQQ